MASNTEDGIRIVTILGTSRPGNFTSKALALAVDELNAQPRVQVTSIDPLHLNLPFPGQPGVFPDREQHIIRAAHESSPRSKRQKLQSPTCRPHPGDYFG